MNALHSNLLDKVVVFRADIFQPHYRDLPHRVWKVTGGYGASEIAMGRTLQCRSLLDQQEARFDGLAVERLATPADLAAIAAAKAG